MIMKPLFFCTVFLAILVSTGFRNRPADGIEGTWVRKTDGLKIRVSQQDENMLTSFIIEEGKEEFPCEVEHLPIYKNIVKLRGTIWNCDFLVVTMGSCSTDYEEGFIRLLANGEMEITCPGFEKKYYTRLNPRLDD